VLTESRHLLVLRELIPALLLLRVHLPWMLPLVRY